MRHGGKALVCLFLLVGSLRAGEFKNATFKGIKNRLLDFEINGQEALISAGDLSFKSFDQDGKPLTGRLGENVRPLVAGNVVNIVTSARTKTFSSKSTGSKVEELTEVHLVKGELAEPGKTAKWPDLSEPRSKRGRRGPDKQDRTTYKAATIKSIENKNIVLEVDGKEVAVVTGNRMKFVDADGKQLKGKGLSKRVFKEGAQVDVTTSKSDDGTETIREVHQVHGTEDEK